MADRHPLLEPERPSSEETSYQVQEVPSDTNAGDGLPPELLDLRSNAILKAHGHKAEMERSFSPLAALGLGFRYAILTAQATSRGHHMSSADDNLTASRIPGSAISAALARI